MGVGQEEDTDEMGDDKFKGLHILCWTCDDGPFETRSLKTTITHMVLPCTPMGVL